MRTARGNVNENNNDWYHLTLSFSSEFFILSPYILSIAFLYFQIYTMRPVCFVHPLLLQFSFFISLIISIIFTPYVLLCYTISPILYYATTSYAIFYLLLLLLTLLFFFFLPYIFCLSPCFVILCHMLWNLDVILLFIPRINTLNSYNLNIKLIGHVASFSDVFMIRKKRHECLVIG